MKILDEYGLEVAIPTVCSPGDVTYVVISRETEKQKSSRIQRRKVLLTKRGNH